MTSLDPNNSTSASMTTPNLLERPSNLNRRKFSFPASLHTAHLLSADPNSTLGLNLTNSSAISARRRLSNVSDVVTRKLSNTIGWKSPQIPAQEIIAQGKCLCGQYIRSRLKRAGVFNRKLGLQRIRSIVGTPTIQIMREVFPALSFVGEELERMHPRTYNGISRQISRTPGDLQSPENTACLLSAVSRDLFKSEITWSKVISLFAISGGLAVECVRAGHPEYLAKLVDVVADIIDEELVSWINDNGGWIGLSLYFRPVTAEFTPLEWIALGLGGILGIFLLIFLLKFIGFHVIPSIFN